MIFKILKTLTVKETIGAAFGAIACFLLPIALLGLLTGLIG